MSLGVNGRLNLEFTSYESMLPSIRCTPSVPSEPMTAAIKKRIEHALLLLPTNERVVNFNHTRAPGPAGSKFITYLLPRREPAG